METPVRPASTVMLLRDAPRGLEVFTLTRASSMVFAAGMTAFPGGGVDPSDADAPLPWTGPPSSWWSGALQLTESAARQQVVAAVRELFEETGVLLAGDAAEDPRSALAARVSVATHQLSLAELLRRHALALRADLLRPWARWITPPGSPRRYDTFFFTAALPAGVEPDFATSEAAAGGWQRPEDVLRAGAAGEVGLMPPTMAMLADLAEAGSVAAALAADRAVIPVTPTLLPGEDGAVRVWANGREYAMRMPEFGGAAGGAASRAGGASSGAASRAVDAVPAATRGGDR